jgi:hypothetical protein
LAADLCQKSKMLVETDFLYGKKTKKVRSIVVIRQKDGKAGKTDGPPAFFRFHRPCQSSLL